MSETTSSILDSPPTSAAARCPAALASRWVEECLPADKQSQFDGALCADPIDTAIAQGLATVDDTADWFARQMNLELWDGRVDLEAAVDLAEKISFEFASDHSLLLVSCIDGRCRCLSAKPWHWQAIDNLSMHLRASVELVIGGETPIRDLIGRVYDQRMACSRPVEAAADRNSQPQHDIVERVMEDLSGRDLLASADKEPIAKLVDALLYDATQKRASDIHVHPYADVLKVRYRLDGVLHDCHQLPRRLHDQLVGRIKVLGTMDVAEKRLAQDGRTSVQIGSRQVDLRIASLPTTCGERVVIRLLEQTAQLKQLADLGMPPDVEKSFQLAIERSTGLILVSGPTGSGKTTTLYSALAQLNATTKNILTLEDPVEYRLAGISQTQVSDKKGMTFLSGLRHILRQDPDVIMVGEIRDEPTARMVIQSSMTGHLVLSTLHTNSAAGAVARLVDLGIEPFLIASSLIGVLAQRLVRICCSTCRHSSDRGCRDCAGTGYRGRTALFEWLTVSTPLREALLKGASAEQLETIAAQGGMQTLRSQGQRMISQGLTTEAELLRVLGTEES